MWDLLRYERHTAVVDELGPVATYGEVDQAGKGLAAAAGGRCLVASLCKNTIGSVVGYAAFLNNRVVPIMLNAHLDKDLLMDLLDTYAPKFIWIPTEQVSCFDTWQPVHSCYDYTLLKTTYSKEYQLHDDLALLLTTSGSTGSPKFVRQSYANVLSNARSIAEYLRLDDTERPITTLPMNYTYGLSIINSHLLAGATLLLTEKGLMQKEFWNFFREQGATSFGGVPYTYEMLERLRFPRMELSSLRYSTQAGGKLTPELHRKFSEYAKEKGTKFIVMYGQCEATARMGYLPPEKALEKCGSIGIAIPGGRFHLTDMNGQKIQLPHVTGELVYEGPNVTMGYAERGEDLIKGDERGGILRTGDLAQFDEDGYYYIVGRKKRFLKIFGNRVNLDEIDRLIKTQFGNIDCASAGVDDHMCLFVTDGTVAGDVRSFVAAKTGLNPAAFKIAVVSEIPKNDAGKTLYGELEKYDCRPRDFGRK